ncbi:MAG: PAS domain-containing protein [Hyphomicrobiaceae bacterium]
MKQDSSIALFRYWNRLREGRAAPRRVDIEPADIKTLLADTFILERDTRGGAVFRLAGTRLCAIYGRELKGFSFPSLWREKDRRLIARIAEGVFMQKSVSVMTFTATSTGGRTHNFEVLILPLEGGTENPRALGIVATETKAFWLGADPVVDASIDSVRVVDPDREPMFLGNRPEIRLPDVPADLPAFVERRRQSDAGRRIRHLVVLEGGRED